MKRTILVIEDDRDISELVRLHLRDAGFEVDVVHDSLSGLERATSSCYELVVLDLMLPGLDVCRRLRARSPYIPILILTSKSTELERVVGLEVGANDLLLHFARHPGRVYTRAQLLDLVWGYGHQGYEHTVNSHPARGIKRSTVSLPPVRWLLRGAALPILADDPADPNRQRIFSAAPILRGGRVEGTLYILIGGDDYDSVLGMLQGSYVLRLASGLLVTSLLLGIATGLLLFRYLTRRLESLASAIEASRQEGFARPLRFSPARDSGAGDEIDRLGVSFHEMARQIHQQMRTLEETDALRRELVANVSHDLRTPLASLRGYVQTLQMKDGRLRAPPAPARPPAPRYPFTPCKGRSAATRSARDGNVTAS